MGKKQKRNQVNVRIRTRDLDNRRTFLSANVHVAPWINVRCNFDRLPPVDYSSQITGATAVVVWMDGKDGTRYAGIKPEGYHLHCKSEILTTEPRRQKLLVLLVGANSESASNILLLMHLSADLQRA